MDFFNYLIEKKLIVLIISLIINLLLLFSCGFLAWKALNVDCEIPKSELAINIEEEKEEVTKSFYVEVKGAVKNPGVYEANSNNIINDIIKLAGGFTKTAYTNNINLSKKVSSELVIYIYTKTEYKKLNETKETSEVIIEPCICPEYDISDCTETGKSEIIANNDNLKDATTNTSSTTDSSNNSSNNQSSNTPKEDMPNYTTDTKKDELLDDETKVEAKLVNINTASKEELMTLNGIGESKAISIIDYRTNSGLFKTVEDIKNVSGIGDAAFEKIKNNITV